VVGAVTATAAEEVATNTGFAVAVFAVAVFAVAEFAVES
jgi:hypothetical protein